MITISISMRTLPKWEDREHHRSDDTVGRNVSDYCRPLRRGERTPLMGNWVNKLREHRGVEKMDESKYAPRVLGYEVVRELYGEGQIFFLS